MSESAEQTTRLAPIGAALANIKADRITKRQNAVAEMVTGINNTRGEKPKSQRGADDAGIDARIEALRDSKRRITTISLVKKAEEVFGTRKEALRWLREGRWRSITKNLAT